MENSRSVFEIFNFYSDHFINFKSCHASWGVLAHEVEYIFEYIFFES